MPTITSRYQHPVIKAYKEKTNISKADVGKKLLKKFGIEASVFFAPSVSMKTQLVYPEKRKILLDHLEECNIVLNNSKYLPLSYQLLKETELILKSVFSDASFNNENFEGIAKDLHYLISHQSLIHDSEFPYHARDLRKALIRDLPINGTNAPQSLVSLKQVVDQKIAQKSSATKIQNVYRSHTVRHSPYITIKKRIQMHMNTLAKNIEFSPTATTSNCNYKEAEIKVIKKFRTLERYECLVSESGDRVKSLLELAQNKSANCEGYAIILYCLIMEDPEIDHEFKETVRIAALKKPEDHVFVTSLPKGKNLQVHDGWFHLVNFKRVISYRKDEVLSKDKSRGYDGDSESYIKFLDAHADGIYVIKGPHSIETIDYIIYNHSENRQLIYKHYYSSTT